MGKKSYNSISTSPLPLAQSINERLNQDQAAIPADQTLLLTVKQAATLMNLSVATVYRLIQTGDIPSLLIRGSRRISREALQEWIREQQHQ